MTRLALALTLLLAPASLAQDDGDEVLRRALAAEAAQVALVARLAPTVAAVFPGEAPGGGGGSGVVIDPRGLVLTNFHVSGLNRVLTVGLSDGRTYRARLLGIDPGGDIALLVLTGRDDFPAVPLGDSDAVRPGERVFAMGNPFLLAEDYSPTVTQGVVSGVHRYRDATGGSDLVYGDAIQIDASINPGNSGGPLFDARGRLIGINGLGGFRPDRGRVNVGVGFAASINQIKNFLFDLRAGRQCQHATMNATVRDQEDEQGRPRVVVDAITREAKAFAAGLRLGDVVRRLDGRPVATQNQLLTLVSRLPAGRRVTLSVARAREDGQGFHERDVTFRLDPLWSGPAQGEWQPDKDLVEAETRRLLEAHRAGEWPTEWQREESIARPGGAVERRVTRMRGRLLRVERGPADARVVEVWDGQRGFSVGPDGPEALTPGRRDVLAGTAEALAALAGVPEATATLTFTGGEWLDGRAVLRLEARDRAGRRRLLYLDPGTHALAGLAYPEEKGAWVEEVHRPGTILRLDHEGGGLLEKADDVRVEPGPQASGLFERPADQEGR
ncbi:MAG: trypsin-like peptidase domain-containing protein [Planctomycetes bacterium]|nr:trypsin-like peptidase domain-containing protein [Planctomycetota bacterium]